MEDQVAKCSKCDKFYGSKEGLCSHCYCDRHGLPKPHGLYLDIENYWKNNNIEPFPKEIYKALMQITKNYIHITKIGRAHV